MARKTEQSKNTSNISRINSDLIGIAKDISYISSDVKEIKEKMESNYVTKDQFEPVKNIVYGMVSLILLAVVGALVALVVNK